jgi:hypothetical protein
MNENNRALWNAAEMGDDKTISLLLQSKNVDIDYQNQDSVWILFDLIF